MQPEQDSITADPTTRYARKSRHKTKTDKYEYKGDMGVPRNPHRHKRRKHDAVGKSPFLATNIDAARVTLRPKPEETIFSRSKTSLPLASRDLPDLTFTKMNFLSRSPEVERQTMMKLKMEQNERREQLQNKSKMVDMPDALSMATNTTHGSVLTASDRLTVSISADDLQVATPEVVHSEEHHVIAESPWIRSQIDPRLEEYLPQYKNTISTRSITQSSSSARAQVAQVAPTPSPKATSLPQGDYLRPGKSSKARLDDKLLQKTPTEDFSHTHTDRLLCRNTNSFCRGRRDEARKGYQSLDDLKGMFHESFGYESTSPDLMEERKLRRARIWAETGEMPSAAACITYGPPFYNNDNTLQTRECQHEALPYSRKLLGSQSERDPSSRRALLYQNISNTNASGEMRGLVWSNSNKQVENPTMFGSDLQGQDEHQAIRSGHELFETQLERRPDAFDLKLLQTADGERARCPSYLAEESGQTKQLNGKLRHGSRQGVNLSLRTSPDHQPRRWRADETLEDQQIFKLIRPSLQKMGTQQAFNPFRLPRLML